MLLMWSRFAIGFMVSQGVLKLISFDRKSYLYPLSSENLDLYRSWRNDYEVRRWCRQVGLISEAQQQAWYTRQDQDPTITMFEVAEPYHLTAVGVCGLTSIDMHARRAEFSCYIAPEHRGNGFAASSLKNLFQHGFIDLGLNIIWGETFEGNPAAFLFEKLGMVKEGVRRDFYFKEGKHINAILYSIKRDELCI